MDLNLTLFKFNLGNRKKRKIVKTIKNPKQDEVLISAVKTKLEKILPKEKKRLLGEFSEPYIYQLEIYNDGTMICFVQSNDRKSNLQVELEPKEYTSFE